MTTTKNEEPVDFTEVELNLNEGQVEGILDAYGYLKGNEEEVECWDDLYIGNDPKLRLSLLAIAGGMELLRGMTCRAFCTMYNTEIEKLITKDGKKTKSDAVRIKYGERHGTRLYKELKVQLQKYICEFPRYPADKWVSKMVNLHGYAGAMLVALRDCLWAYSNNVREEDRAKMWKAVRAKASEQLTRDDFILD